MDEDCIELCGVVLRKKGVELVEGGSTTASFGMEAVRKLSLRRGSVSNRPLLQLLVAIVIGAVGLWPLRGIVTWLVYGGDMVGEIIMMLLLVPFAIWLGYEAVKRGVFLFVESSQGLDKLPLSRRPTEREVQAVVADARSRFSVEIESFL